MKLLRSFEDLIFEAMTWLLFYPRTLLRVIWRPLTAMAYSDAEQEGPEDARYDGALSPTLMLLFTAVLVSLLNQAFQVPPPAAASKLAKAIFESQQNYVLFRSVSGGVIPLVAAALLLRRQKMALSRRTLRPPFYAQCYLAAPYALVSGVGWIVLHRHDLPNAMGVLAIATAVVWLLAAQTRWFVQKLSVSLWRGVGLSVLALVLAEVLLILIAIPIVYL
jgi:hypothetical protein